MMSRMVPSDIGLLSLNGLWFVFRERPFAVPWCIGAPHHAGCPYIGRFRAYLVKWADVLAYRAFPSLKAFVRNCSLAFAWKGRTKAPSDRHQRALAVVSPSPRLLTSGADLKGFTECHSSPSVLQGAKRLPTPKAALAHGRPRSPTVFLPPGGCQPSAGLGAYFSTGFTGYLPGFLENLSLQSEVKKMTRLP